MPFCSFKDHNGSTSSFGNFQVHVMTNPSEVFVLCCHGYYCNKCCIAWWRTYKLLLPCAVSVAHQAQHIRVTLSLSDLNKSIYWLTDLIQIQSFSGILPNVEPYLRVKIKPGYESAAVYIYVTKDCYPASCYGCWWNSRCNKACTVHYSAMLIASYALMLQVATE